MTHTSAQSHIYFSARSSATLDRSAVETYPLNGGLEPVKPGAGNILTVPPPPQVLYCEIDGLEVEVTPHDFSPAGFFVQTISVPAAHSDVEIFLRSGVGSITVNAMVVKVVSLEDAADSNSAPGFGALFTDLSESDRVFLARTSEEVQRSLQPPTPPAAGSKPATKSAREPAPREPKPPANAVLPRRMARPVRVTQESLQPGAGRPKDPNRERSRVMVEVTAMLERDSKRAPWRILRVNPGASVKDAKRAFLALAKQHHPHVYARHKDPKINAIATRLFIIYKNAYSDFCKEAARKAGKDELVIDSPRPDSKPQGRGTQHTARLWNERRSKADG